MARQLLGHPSTWQLSSTLRLRAIIGITALQLVWSAAAALSLDNFQNAPVTVSTICDIAYGQQIESCTEKDFQGSDLCSASCIQGLETEAKTLRLLCMYSEMNVDSLLGQILQGDIVSLLCASSQAAISDSTPGVAFTTSASRRIATTTIQSLSSVTAAKTTSVTTVPVSPSILSLPSITAISRSNTSPVVSTPSTLSTFSSISSISMVSIVSTSSSTGSMVPTSEASIVSEIPTSSPTTMSVNIPKTTTLPLSQSSPKKQQGFTIQEQQIIAISNSGGGSPFDIIVSSGAQGKGAGFAFIIAMVWTGIILGG